MIFCKNTDAVFHHLSLIDRPVADLPGHDKSRMSMSSLDHGVLHSQPLLGLGVVDVQVGGAVEERAGIA